MTTCPICLSPPSAPRMTKCGHVRNLVFFVCICLYCAQVFCYPCVLHYLQTSSTQNWARCPICFDSINEKQLKSVRWYDEPTIQDDSSDPSQEASSSSSHIEVNEGDTPKPGSTLRMRLMERPQITTLALPRADRKGEASYGPTRQERIRRGSCREDARRCRTDRDDFP